jgi:hypothetical protein
MKKISYIIGAKQRRAVQHVQGQQAPFFTIKKFIKGRLLRKNVFKGYLPFWNQF